MKYKAFSLIELSIAIVIIGILITGTIKGQQLIDKSKLNSARSFTKSSSVNGVSGLLGWWETTSEKSFNSSEAKNGKLVSNWYNIAPESSGKYVANQSTSSNQPTYSSGAINGLPALNFDGSNDYLEISNYYQELNSLSFSLFAVVKISSAPTSYKAIFTSKDSSSGGYGLFAGSGPKYFIFVYNGSANNASGGFSPSNSDVVSAIYNSDTANATLYKNGVIQSAISASMVVNGNSARKAVIGSDKSSGSATYFFAGYIGEIILFDRVLLSEERKSVEAYLAKKWGIKISY